MERFPTEDEIVKTQQLFVQRDAMRLPVLFLVEDTRFIKNYKRDILDFLKNAGKNMKKSEELRNKADICILTYNDKTHLVMDFAPLEGIPENINLECNYTGQPDLGDAILKALTRINMRKGDYDATLINSYRPSIIILGSGDALKNNALARALSVASDIQMSGIISFAPVLIGSGDPSMFRRLAGACYDGSDLSRVLGALIRGMQTLSSSSENTYASLIEGAVEWEQLNEC